MVRRFLSGILCCALVVAGSLGVLSAGACYQPTYLIVQVAASGYDAYVAGDTVVYAQGGTNRSIYARDLVTGAVTPMCTATGYRVLTGFDGATAVWFDQRDDVNGDIYAYDVDTDTESAICTDSAGQNHPAVDGDVVVWEDARSGGFDIYMKYLSGGAESALVTGTVDQFQPDVSGDTVVWIDNRNGDFDVFAKDIPSGIESEVCAATGNQAAPAIDGDVVVWQDSRGADDDIYMCDLSTGVEKAVCTATGNQASPRVSGDLIVWEDNRTGSLDIYGYNISTGEEFYVTKATGEQQSPDIDGTTVVFDGDGASGVGVYVAIPDTFKPKSWSDNKGTYTGSAAIKIESEDTFELLGSTHTGSGVANIHYKVDDADWSVYYDDTYTLNYDQLGEHQLVYKAQDMAGILETPYHYEDFTIVSDGTYEYEPVAGENRYETSVEVSKQTYPDGAESVVVATAVNWPDALGGAALAGTVDGPILLVKKDSVPAAIGAEIERLGAHEVIILGGTAVVSEATEASLLKLGGVETVERIGGDTRFETAELIAEETVGRLEGAWSHTAFMATGDNFPDALAAAPIAARRGWPIFLAKPNGSVPIPAMQEQGVERVYILGGPAVVTDEQEALLVTAFGEENVIRLQGENRYETAVVVAQYGVDNVGLFWDGVTIATGENFPDALTGGIIPATNGSVMVLTKTDSLPSSLASKLNAEEEWIHDVYYLGGTSAISQAVRDQVAQILE